MSDAIVVLITAGSADDARRLAGALVEEGLAACVNVVAGVRSIYRWQGEVCDEAEALMVVKSTRDRFDALEKRVLELHSYEVPEIIALPIAEGSGPYLAWLTGEVA